MAQITLTPIIEGTLAKASEVMGNFQAIADEVNGNLDGSNLKDNIITSAKIVDGAVTDTKLASGSVDTTNLKNNAVTEAKLATGSVSSSKIVDGAVSGSKIAGSTITADNLANGAVTTPKLDDRAVTSSKLDNSSVGTTKLSDGAVTAPKLGTNAVTESKVATDAVSTDKIQNGAVTRDKIQDGAVTNSKVATGLSASKLTTGTLPIARLPTGAHNSNNVSPGQDMTGSSNSSRNPIGCLRLLVTQQSSGVNAGDNISGNIYLAHAYLSGDDKTSAKFGQYGLPLPGTWQALSTIDPQPIYAGFLPFLAVRVS